MRTLYELVIWKYDVGDVHVQYSFNEEELENIRDWLNANTSSAYSVREAEDCYCDVTKILE